MKKILLFLSVVSCCLKATPGLEILLKLLVSPWEEEKSRAVDFEISQDEVQEPATIIKKNVDHKPLKFVKPLASKGSYHHSIPLSIELINFHYKNARDHLKPILEDLIYRNFNRYVKNFSEKVIANAQSNKINLIAFPELPNTTTLHHDLENLWEGSIQEKEIVSEGCSDFSVFQKLVYLYMNISPLVFDQLVELYIRDCVNASNILVKFPPFHDGQTLYKDFAALHNCLHYRNIKYSNGKFIMPMTNFMWRIRCVISRYQTAEPALHDLYFYFLNGVKNIDRKAEKIVLDENYFFTFVQAYERLGNRKDNSTVLKKALIKETWRTLIRALIAIEEESGTEIVKKLLAALPLKHDLFIVASDSN